MERQKAYDIANSFLTEINPDYWDGKGEKPSSFVELIWEYDLSEYDRLDISMEYSEEDKCWIHFCEIVDKKNNMMTEILTGYGIDSVENLTDTILDICKEYE